METEPDVFTPMQFRMLFTLAMSAPSPPTLACWDGLRHESSSPPHATAVRGWAGKKSRDSWRRSIPIVHSAFN